MKPIVIIGVGALGSHLVQFLRNTEAPIEVVDFDSIEPKNLLGQFHTSMSRGRKKVLALQQTMLGLWGMKVTAIPHKLTVDNTKQLLGHAAVVIDCVDNSETRKLIQDTVRELCVPCLHGALSQDGSFWRSVWDKLFTVDNLGNDVTGQATCEHGEGLPVHAMAASHLANGALHFLKTGEQISVQGTPWSVTRIG